MTEESKTFDTDAIWDIIGRKSNKFHRQNIQLEIKQDKTELRHLIAAEFRLFILKTKSLKLEQSIHYSDVTEVHSNNIQKLSISAEGRHVCMTSCGDEHFSGLLSFVFERYSTINYHLPMKKRMPHLNVSDDIMPTINYALKIPESHPHLLTPCGNFTTVYHSKCDQIGVEYHEDVAWDIDAIYNSQNCCELNLSDFDHLPPKNMIPMLSSLEYNKWFIKLNLSNIKMTSDIQNELLKILKLNETIEDINLSNTGIKSDFLSKLFAMKCPSLKSVDLSCNNLDDKAFLSMSTFLSASNMTSLNLSKSSITSTGVNNLVRVLSNSQAMCSLVCLDISGNSLKDEVVALQNFLAIPNNIKVLKLADTETPLENFFAASIRGCTQHLEVLDLSGCQLHLGGKKNSAVPISWKQFFGSVSKLRMLNLSNNKFAPGCFKSIFEGLEENTVANDIDVNFSGCQIGLSSATIQIFEHYIGKMTKISSLDLSDNGFDQSLGNILSKLANNKTLKKLSIGRNLTNVKAKFLHQVVESLVAMVQEDGSKLETLSLDGLKFKGDLMDFINSLGLNTSLVQLDISGNMIGDAGAKMLAKALQINRKLITLILDNNQFTCTGYEYIASSLEKNTTLKVLPLPVIDLIAATRLNADKTERALRKIESKIVRNNSSNLMVNMEPAYKLHQWISNAEHEECFNKNVLELSQIIDAIKTSDIKLEDSLKEKLTICEKIQQEAKDVKNVLGDLHKLSLEKFESINMEISKIFHEKAKEFSDSCSGFVNKNYDSSLRGFSQKCRYNPSLTPKEEAELEREVHGSVKTLSSRLLGAIAYEKSRNMAEFLISSVALSVEFALVNVKSIHWKHFKGEDEKKPDEGMKSCDDEKMEEKKNGSKKYRIRPTSSIVLPSGLSGSNANNRLSMDILLDGLEIITPIPKPRNKKKKTGDARTIFYERGDDDDNDGVQDSSKQNYLDVAVPPSDVDLSKVPTFLISEGRMKSLFGNLVKSASHDELDGRNEVKDEMANKSRSRDALEEIVPCHGKDVDQSDGAKMSCHDLKDDITHEKLIEDIDPLKSPIDPPKSLINHPKSSIEVEDSTQKLTHLCKSRPKRQKNKVGSRPIMSFIELKDDKGSCEVDRGVHKESAVKKDPNDKEGVTEELLMNVLVKKHQNINLPQTHNFISSSSPPLKFIVDVQNDSLEKPIIEDSHSFSQLVEHRKTTEEESCINELNVPNKRSCEQVSTAPSVIPGVVKRALPPGAKPGLGKFAMPSISELQQKRLSMRPIDSSIEKSEEKRNSSGTILDSTSGAKIKTLPPLAPKPIKGFRDSRRESDTNPVIIIDDKNCSTTDGFDEKSKDEEPPRPASFMEEFRKKQEKNRNS